MGTKIPGNSLSARNCFQTLPDGQFVIINISMEGEGKQLLKDRSQTEKE